jgi:hypothetical protein
MGKGTALLGLLVALAAPAHLLAHEGHDHVVMGVVTTVDADHLEVRTQEGKVVAARLTKDTKYFKGQEPATLADVKEGLRAALRVRGEGKALTAGEVRLPSESKEKG